jgi:MtN3 and saliva related transmembrane protein
MSDTVLTVVGLVAASLTSFAFLPQVRKMWRRRSVGDISPTTFVQMFAGSALWLAYGVGRRDAIIIAANVVALTILVAGIALYFRFREMKARGVIHGTLLGAEALGADPLVAVRESSHGIVRAAAESGGDPGAVARAAVQEAVQGTRAALVHVTPEQAASAVAEGAVAAAGEMGESAARAVREAVADLVPPGDARPDPRD